MLCRQHTQPRKIVDSRSATRRRRLAASESSIRGSAALIKPPATRTPAAKSSIRNAAPTSGATPMKLDDAHSRYPRGFGRGSPLEANRRKTPNRQWREARRRTGGREVGDETRARRWSSNRNQHLFCRDFVGK
jgi:hypothetical protein